MTRVLSKLNTTNFVRPFGERWGLPGRAANSGITATVFGAYGFVGKYFLSELGAVGSRVYVPFRGCELEVRHLKPLFDLGQLGTYPFHPRDEESIIQSLAQSDVVVNLVGKHYETKHFVPTRRGDGSLSRVNFGFEEVHQHFPANLARLCQAAGVKAFIHVSSLTANIPDSKSAWSQSKRNGEAAVLKEFPYATIVRPATIFGPEDRFLLSLAEAMDKLPITPIVNNGNTLSQPVYSHDVGRALMVIVNNWQHLQGRTVELCGPAEYSQKEIVEYVSDVTHIKKPIVDIPVPVATAVGTFANQFMNPWLTVDGVHQACEDVLPTANDPSIVTLSDLGIEGSSMDKVAFDFLYRFRPGGHFKLAQGYH